MSRRRSGDGMSTGVLIALVVIATLLCAALVVVMYMDKNGEYFLTSIVNKGNLASTIECIDCEAQSSVTINNSTIVGKAIGRFRLLGVFVNFFTQKWFLTLLAVVGP